MLARDRLYERPGELVTLLGLHDVRRFMDEPGATVAGLKLAFTFLLTARGIPLVYYGDEIAMPGGVDPDNRRDFPGGWSVSDRVAWQDKVGPEAQGRGPRLDEVGGGLEVDAPGGNEVDLGQGRLQGLDVGGSSQGAARKDLDHVGTGLPGGDHFGRSQGPGHHGHPVAAAARDRVSVQGRAHHGPGPRQDAGTGGLGIEDRPRAHDRVVAEAPRGLKGVARGYGWSYSITAIRDPDWRRCSRQRTPPPACRC